MSLVAHPMFSSSLSSPSGETLPFSKGGKGAQTGEETQFPAGDSLRHYLTTPFPLHFGTPQCGPG